MLATLKAELCELSKVRRILKLFGVVNCTADFTPVPDVITEPLKVEAIIEVDD